MMLLVYGQAILSNFFFLLLFMSTTTDHVSKKVLLHSNDTLLHLSLSEMYPRSLQIFKRCTLYSANLSVRATLHLRNYGSALQRVKLKSNEQVGLSRCFVLSLSPSRWVVFIIELDSLPFNLVRFISRYSLAFPSARNLF